jgi:hypothetical protein
VPVREDEALLRLIPKGWVKTRGPDQFGRVAFEPKPHDADGISLYRERFLRPERLVTALAAPANYFVV